MILAPIRLALRLRSRAARGATLARRRFHDRRHKLRRLRIATRRAGCRACRRQPNSCCGVSPCRRAISETTAPGASVSSMIRALSSAENRRRRPVPVITSSRRTACLRLKRMVKHRHKPISNSEISTIADHNVSKKVAVRTPLTIEALYRRPRTTKPEPVPGRSVSAARTMDITYIPMERALVHFSVVLGWLSPCVLWWPLLITTEAVFCVAMLEDADSPLNRRLPA